MAEAESEKCSVQPDTSKNLYIEGQESELERSLRNDKDTRHILLIGIPGSGKSTFGNSLLGRKDFVAGCSTKSLTQKVFCGVGHRKGKEIVVFDTPGIEKDDENNKRALDILSKCFWCLSPGFHVVALVIALGRITKEHLTLLKELKRVFDNKCLKYLLVVFTRLDDLGDNSLERLIDEAEPVIKDLTKGGRYIGINNKAEGEVMENQLCDFFNKVESMYEKNDFECYTDSLFKESHELLKKKAKECGMSEADARTNLTPPEEQKEEVKKRFLPCTIL
ncbi:GTPase IMAP family member 4-like [Saccostrea cucullata]|uniref:GTPase IMAP family member 4-like n=1 Tax=Saccostrea cuccullata TaxID=36930 RepID=UPI002ECFB1F6